MRSKFPEFYPVSKERIKVASPIVLNRLRQLPSFSKTLWTSLIPHSNVSMQHFSLMNQTIRYLPLAGIYQNRDENEYDDWRSSSALFSEKMDVVIFR